MITARGGSKRIPRKNVRLMFGVPLVARAIGLVLESEQFDRIVVSTDDDEIARVSVAAGAEYLWRRPPSLADDRTGTSAVMAHAVEACEAEGVSAPLIACVYPGAVFVAPADYANAIRVLSEDERIDYVFTATDFHHPIQRALRQLPAGGCEMIAPQFAASRTQDLELAFHDAGQFYIGRRESWLAEKPVYTERSRMHLMPHSRVQDVDSLEDWARAEEIFRLTEMRLVHPSVVTNATPAASRAVDPK